MLAFIHIHKTAGTTLYHILRQSFGAQHCDIKVWPSDGTDQWDVPRRVLTAYDLRKTKWLYWRLKSIRGHRVVGYSDLHVHYPTIRYYTFMREPLVRTASYFQFIKKNDRMASRNPLPFEEWIRKPINQNEQCVLLCGEPNAEKAIEVIRDRVHFVGLQERFDESLVMLKRWAKPYNLEIRYQSRNVARESLSIKKDLLNDPTTRTLLEEANKEDQKLYAFVKEEWYPRMVRDYGEGLEEDIAHFHQENSAFKTGFWNPLMNRLVRIGLYRPLLKYLSHGRVMN